MGGSIKKCDTGFHSALQNIFSVHIIFSSLVQACDYPLCIIKV